jgi:hypothetical protein
MKALADALVYAVAFIDSREPSDDEDEDQDVGALESIAYYLGSATDKEKDALAAAAERALAAELKSSRPNKALVRDYKRWMENMFVGEWVGNKRK